MKLKKKTLDIKESALDRFARLVHAQENCFLLETLEDKDQPQTTRRSYIGISPRRIFSATAGGLFIDGRKRIAYNPYFALRKYFSIDAMPDEGYVGGLVGYFAHEAIVYFESLDFRYPRRFPDFQFGEYRDGLVFKPDRQPEYFYYDNDRSNQYLQDKSASPGLSIKFEGAAKTKAEHAEMIKKARRDITEGRVFQVVLANNYRYSYAGDLMQLYRSLRAINPSPFMFFIKFGEYITLGASPELLVHTRPAGDIYLEALAGTTRRGQNEREDLALQKQLLGDDKETAEHAMLVDLARNDAGRISRISSVEIDKLMIIKKLSHVQHICSIVKGKLAADKDIFDSLAASFPAGTLSGAPKIEAIKMISELEANERGPYGGSIGYFSYNGDSMQAMNLRSLSAAGNKLFVHSGSGIVYDSRPEREYQEISAKKAAMDRAIKEFLV